MTLIDCVKKIFGFAVNHLWIRHLFKYLLFNFIIFAVI